MTIGSKEGLAHLMLATLDRGDTVLVPNPSYPIHMYGAVIAGADIRSVPIAPGVDFFAEVEGTIRGSYPKPKMIVLGFPSNPTTQCVELEFFTRLVELARKHDILVVHDLAYADIVFDGWKAPSIMQVPGAKDVAVEFFTLSKSYNMAGWRIGFMVGNAELVNALARIKSYHDYGTFTPRAGGGHRRARGRPAVREGHRRDLPAPPRRAREGNERRGLARRGPQSVDVRLGSHSGTIPCARLARVLEATARQGESVRGARRRVRRPRR